MSREITFGELFAGVGGFSLGAETAGWRGRWQVEWDKHCSAVLARHWPAIPRYGDIREVSGRDLEPVDAILFGSPCQDLSVAGKRAGLAGERSGLFFEAVRIIEEMRDATGGVGPRLVVWENVAGALSSNQGADFLAVLDAFARLGAMDIAWRILDAQHFGVPQRRRRIFVVADLAGECAGALHVEPQSVRWHPPARRAEREETPSCPGGGSPTVVSALTKGLGSGGPDPAHAYARWLIPVTGEPAEEPRSPESGGAYPIQDVAGTLSGGAHPGGLNGQDAYSGQLVIQPFPVQSKAINRTDLAGQHGKGYGEQGDPMFTLDRGGPHAIVQPFVKSKRARSDSDDETWIEDAPAPTLNPFDNNAESRATVLLFDPGVTGPLTGSGMTRARGTESVESSHVLAIEEDVVGPLTAGMHRGPRGTEGIESRHVLPIGATVRRLTPLECERLMGWPDDHTRYRADGSEQSDSQRYRQCGNGVASPVVAWIAAAISEALDREAQE